MLVASASASFQIEQTEDALAEFKGTMIQAVNDEDLDTMDDYAKRIRRTVTYLRSIRQEVGRSSIELYCMELTIVNFQLEEARQQFHPTGLEDEEKEGDGASHDDDDED